MFFSFLWRRCCTRLEFMTTRKQIELFFSLEMVEIARKIGFSKEQLFRKQNICLESPQIHADRSISFLDKILGQNMILFGS